jgi:hypothetical protein
MPGDISTACSSIRVSAGAVAAALSVALTPTAQAGPQGTDRPIEGACETTVTLLSAPGTFPVILAVDLGCHLTHLGLTGGGTKREVVIPAGPPNGNLLPVYISIEKIAYIAADGDELWSTYAGPGTIDIYTGNATFSGTETFIGGTGRFLNATGTSHTAGQGSLVDNRGFLTISGTISY